jgi:hypothetical protein
MSTKIRSDCFTWPTEGNTSPFGQRLPHPSNPLALRPLGPLLKEPYHTVDGRRHYFRGRFRPAVLRAPVSVPDPRERHCARGCYFEGASYADAVAGALTGARISNFLRLAEREFLAHSQIFLYSRYEVMIPPSTGR